MERALYVPGPVPLPEPVRQAMLQPMLSRRSPDFSEIIIDVTKKLKDLTKTSTNSILIPASGTGAMECALQNILSPGDKVLALPCGVFGNRFAEIARRLGAIVIEENIDWGEGVDLERLPSLLRSNPSLKAILVTHNETSTGVVNPVQEIAAVIPENGPFLVVDAVSSLGAIPCYPEEWRFDALVSSSQKGLLCPPGIGLVWFSERVWDLVEKRGNSIGSYYFNLLDHREMLNLPLPTNPYTPPMSLYFALQASLDYISKESFDSWFIKKAEAAKIFVSGIQALGLEPFVEDPYFRSPAMSVVRIPNEKATSVQKDLRSFGIEIAAGMGQFKEKSVRIAHYHDGAHSETLMILSALYVSGKRNGIVVNDHFLKELQEYISM